MLGIILIMHQDGTPSRGGARPKVAPVGWVHLEGRYTIRWRRGDPVEYVLDLGMAGVLDTIPASPSGWTDLAEVRLVGQRWLHRQRTQQSA